MDFIAVIFGHSDYIHTNENERMIKNALIYAIEEKHITIFYLGGYGAFDYWCAKYIKDLKKNYYNIKSYLILAYLNNKKLELERKEIDMLYNGTIYPPIETVPLRLAIIYRNKWMIDQADFIIFYVNHSWGGASKSMEYAKKKNKDFINLGNKK